MKVLVCHNYYQHPGGEDQSYAAEAQLLEAHGHEVVRYELDNAAIAQMAGWDVARRTLWNQSTYQAVRAIILRERPQIMHCTNTFPLISPAAYYAAQHAGVAVVQSLRNYRLMCPNAFLMREHQVCEACLGRWFAWPGIRHACYRENRAATTVVAALQTLHRVIGTWRRAVDMYFTPSEFTRQKHIAAGFPAERIAVKPNFIDPDPGVGAGEGGFAIFVGRLSEEKGIDTLIAAWKRLGGRLALKIVGDGPLAAELHAAAAGESSIEFLGRRTPAEVLELVGQATCLVMPSRWYETFGRTIVEAFAKGTPAVVARLGAMAELVDHGRTGFVFEPNQADDLAQQIGRLLDHPTQLASMRSAARREYEAHYTAEPNYTMLRHIYQRALANHTLRREMKSSSTDGNRPKSQDFTTADL